MPDRTGDAGAATATDTPDRGVDDESDTTVSYPGDAQSSLARWRRQVVQARLDPRQTTLPEWVGRESTPAGGTTVGRRAVQAALSPRVVVAVGLIVDLVIRVLVDVGPVAVGLVELLAPVVSLSAGTVTPAVVGVVTTWLVLLGVSYAVAPRLFPRVVRAKLDTVGFRLLFVGLVAGFGAMVIVGSDTGPTRTTEIGALVLSSGVVTTAAYFRRRPDWDLLHPDGEGTALLDAIARGDAVAERRTDWRRTGLVGAFADTLHAVAVGLLVCLPAFVVGVLAAGFVDIQPLPDLLAVGVLASGLLGLRSGSSRVVTADIEERVLSNAREATRTIKGAILSLLLAAGAATTALVLSAVLSDVPSVVRLVTQAITAGRAGVPGAFGTAWVAVGFVVCGLVGTLQLLWMWGRLSGRLPAFLAAWRGADEVPRVPVARPPGWLFPGSLALGAAGGCLLLFGVRPIPVVGWLWPLGVVPAALTPVVARRRDESLDGAVPETESWYLVVTTSSQPILVTVGSWAVVRVGSGEPFTLATLDGSIGSLLALSTILPVWAYFPDVTRHADRHDDLRQYTHAAYVAATGVWLVTLGVRTTLPLAAAFRALGVSCLVGAGALTVVRFVESE